MSKNSNVPRGTILTERLRPSTGTSECSLFDDLKNKRIFALVHWSEWTGTQILEHSCNPAILRKHLRAFSDRLNQGDNALVKHVFAVVPFEVPRYYFQ